jgi:hypothetical protein
VIEVAPAYNPRKGLRDYNKETYVSRPPEKLDWFVMGVFFVRPRVNELVFQLYGRPLHPELFEILQSRTFRREDYEVTLWITRSGHVITWRTRDLWLTEVAAAAEQPLPDSRRLLSYRLRGEHSGSLTCGDNISYQMLFQVETLQPAIFLQVQDEILADGNKRGLLHTFRSHERFGLAPLGFVTMESRAGCLFLTTFHTFPDEYTIVKSQSLIEKKR